MYGYTADLESFIAGFRSQVEDQMLVQEASLAPRGRGILFVGQLLRDPESAFNTLYERLVSRGYLPFLQKRQGRDSLLITAYAERGAYRYWINLILFIATIFTTLLAGAQMELGAAAFRALLRNPLNILAGTPFAFSLLFILGTHEMGHYVVSRIKGMRVSLPYFIPIPPLGFTLGTLGAFIRMDSPVKDRKGFFDVGLAGPLAGLVVAIPVFVLGLRGSEIVSLREIPPGGAIMLGESILSKILERIAMGPLSPNETVLLNPVAFAGWLGLFLTGMNLLPAGQLDGGHAAYALFGRAFPLVANLTLLGLLGMGFFLQQPQWFFWAFFIMLSGPSHPRPLNDISGLDPVRMTTGAFAILLLFLLIIPQPFS